MSELERFTGGTLAPGLVAGFEVAAFWGTEFSLFSSGFGAGAAAAFFGSSAGGLVVVSAGFGADFAADLGAAGGGTGGLPPVLRYDGI